MTRQQILDSIYIIPVILDHLDEPSENTKKILQENEITDELLQEMSLVKHLLQYHYGIVKNNYYGHYPTLRKGLSEYFDQYLSAIWDKIGLMDKELLLLDYGCGYGQYSRKFLEVNPRSEVMLVDKEMIGIENSLLTRQLCVDWEKDREWFKGFIDTFNVVLLSEVLHCKTLVQQDYLIDTSHLMLKEEGLLIINENLDHCMEYRITKIKSYPSPVINYNRIKLLTENKFDLKNFVNINQHYIYVYEKI